MSALRAARAALDGPQETYPNPGQYRDPMELSIDNMTSIPKNLARKADRSVSRVTTVPLAAVVVGYLYHRTFIAGNPDREWDPGDAFLVLVAAWIIVTIGVERRWSGVMA